MKNTLLFAKCLISLFSFSQQQYFPLWHKQWAGTTFIQKFYEIDGAGNHIICGDLNGTYDFDPGPGVYNLNTSSGNDGGALMKLDSNGNFIWARKFVAPNDIYISKMSVDANGNVYLVIQYAFSGAIDVDPGPGTVNVAISASMPEDILVSLDKNGNYRWHRQFASGTSSLYFNHLKTDRYNRIFIYATNLNNTIDIDPGSSVVSMPAGNYYVKYDTLGNYVWSRGIGFNPSFPGISKLDFDYDNNVITAGNYDNTIDFDYGPGSVSLVTPPINNPYHYFVMKTDSQMNFIWATGFHSNGSAQMIKTVVDTANNILVCGDFSSLKFCPKYNDTTYFHVGPGGWNPYIIKYNSAGNYIRDFYLNGPNPEDFDVALDGKVYVSGVFAGTRDFDPGPSAFNLTGGVAGDAFMALYDSSFNFYRAYKYTNQPTPDDYQCGWFIRSWYNTIYLYSLQNGNVNYGTLSFPYMINSTYAKALIKFNLQSVMVGIDVPSGSGFSIYPNPLHSYATLRTANPVFNATLTLENCLGQTVAQIKNISGQIITFERNNLPCGLYFIRLEQDNTVIGTAKIVISD